MSGTSMTLQIRKQLTAGTTTTANTVGRESLDATYKMKYVERFTFKQLATALFLAIFFHSNLILAADTQFDIRQAKLSGISGDFYIPTLDHHLSPPGKFDVLLWQRNPARPDGRTVPVRSWDGGIKTGLHVPLLDRALRQAGFANSSGTTIAQIAPTEVGAYINSKDIPLEFRKHDRNSMMITPEYRFIRSDRPKPFTAIDRCVEVSFDLQVPTASDAGNIQSRSYVTFDLEFLDTVHRTLISLNVNVFHNAPVPARQQSTYFDGPTKNYVLFSLINSTSKWFTVLRDSATHQSTPWLGYKNFHFDICYNNFRDAVSILQVAYPNLVLSQAPESYQLISFHLNSEIIFNAGDAELGWSMRALRVSSGMLPN
jgi:hypothetical protein